jgi:phosphatidylglycerophosphatase A
MRCPPHSTISHRDAMSDAETHPSASFLFAHPAHFIALGAGAGLSRYAPGTVGTLVALPIAWLLHTYVGDTGFVLAICAALAGGAWASQVTGHALGARDHGGIVIDEIAAFLLVLFFVGPDVRRQALAFVLFRVFDILKPPPIRAVDTALKNGIGVMADDVLAAGYTLLVMAVGQRLRGGSA